ncbi:universal stress protein in QAH/OAS sulfhydrylase 3'region-like isoform X2 [Physella acuta]|uniref:universal stress protein in QAH/OAS sulfhydrylase 3'region-like isoform X2 n=1 Tax=Physella acuta TaxID=109671 RepID=UPI0027DCDE89|nr:universal stress protein in QAH/OAS sulfhydrylase 3'region-like isoform X2 [Physella acuta]
MADTGAQRIVAIAIDESEHSDNAFQWYCEHIYKENDYLLLIHVPETYDFTMASPAVVEQLLKELEERVDNLEKKYREKLLSRGISGKFRTASGKPGEKIVSVARDERATLIITGTRGLGKFRRTILGSVSDYIVHHSNVPVLVCRWKTQEDGAKS